MLAAGSVLNGRYRLDRQIGQGGFARVFLGTDLRLKRLVAIKVLNQDLVADEGSGFLARFEREAQAVAALDHPNILAVHDSGEAEGTVFLVMPYIADGSLHDKLRATGPLGLRQTGDYLRQVAAALDYAHRRAIVHRDIKPQNMLLRAEDDRVWLADFGIAKVLGATSGQSSTGILGTLSYMSPEQLNGQVGRATDIYALGCVLFQLLTGQLPYAGPTEQVVLGHLTQSIPSLAERSQGRLPATLQGVIDRAMAKDPAARFGSAGELSGAYEATIAAAQTSQGTRGPTRDPLPAPVLLAPAPTEVPDRPPSGVPASPTMAPESPPGPREVPAARTGERTEAATRTPALPPAFARSPAQPAARPTGAPPEAAGVGTPVGEVAQPVTVPRPAAPPERTTHRGRNLAIAGCLGSLLAMTVLSVMLGLAAVNWVHGALGGDPTPSVNARAGTTDASAVGGQPAGAAAPGTAPVPASARPTTTPAVAMTAGARPTAAPGSRGPAPTPTAVVVGGITPGGPGVPVNITTPGQDVALTFAGEAGQRVTLRRRESTTRGLTYVRLIRPDGEELTYTVGEFMDVQTLPVAGTYTVVVDPSDTGTGAFTVTLHNVPPDVTGPIVPGGAAVPVNITVPGQNAALTFDAGAGQRVSLRRRDSTIQGLTYVRLLRPDGEELVYTVGEFMDVQTLPAAGTYTVQVDPGDFGTGGLTLLLYAVPPDMTGSIAPNGMPVSLNIAAPGQNGTLTFDAIAGQRVSIRRRDNTIPGLTYIRLLRPDGEELSYTVGEFMDVQTLPVAGTYTLKVDPSDTGTGRLNLLLYTVPPDLTGPITLGGPAVPVSISTPGQNAAFSFEGRAGQRVILRRTNNTIPGLTYIRLLKPDGEELAYTVGDALDPQTLPVAGTYTIKVDPNDTGTGGLAVTLATAP